MFKKFFILLMLNSVTVFSSPYTAPSKEIQQCLDDLHKQASLSNIREDALEEIGKLYACLFIEKVMNLPESEDAIYIDEKERKLNLLELNDSRMQIVDCQMKSTLEQIKASGSKFSKAAEKCLKDFCR